MSRKRIEQFLIKWATKVHGDYGRYSKQVATNRVRNLLSRNNKVKHKYLFILCPPNCGSTLTHRIISSSASVSTNNPYGAREGQQLPTVKPHMRKRFYQNVQYDWHFIKKEWRKYWDLSMPILLEKSPPNLVRAEAISQHFRPAYFIIMVRNPYAHCEVLIRGRKMSPGEAAEFSLNCLRIQKKNIQTLNNAISFSYELLTTNLSEAKRRIVELLPQLSDINIDQKYMYRKEKVKISNLNEKCIARLLDSQITDINAIFETEKALIEEFGYEMI